jgi:Uma2 family endonuclease
LGEGIKERTLSTIAQPSQRLMTIAEFIALPDDGIRRELVRGKAIEMPQPKPLHGYVCAEIAARLREYVKPRNLGRVVAESGIITERNADSMRGPDVSYYSFDRLPPGKMPDAYLDVLPELVVEVLSTFDRWPRVLEKIVEYLDSGVKLVCIIDPDSQSAQVHMGDQPVRHMTRNEDLTFPDLLPDFRCRISELFE